jgi:ActR/RegA family two-component response regulator
MTNSSHGPRLLMIDDDLAFCRLIKRVAEPHGFEVIATDDTETVNAYSSVISARTGMQTRS